MKIYIKTTKPSKDRSNVLSTTRPRIHNLEVMFIKGNVCPRHDHPSPWRRRTEHRDAPSASAPEWGPAPESTPAFGAPTPARGRQDGARSPVRNVTCFFFFRDFPSCFFDCLVIFRSENVLFFIRIFSSLFVLCYISI